MDDRGAQNSNWNSYATNHFSFVFELWFMSLSLSDRNKTNVIFNKILLPCQSLFITMVLFKVKTKNLAAKTRFWTMLWRLGIRTAFFLIWEDISPFVRVTDTPVLDFWWCLLWVLKPEWAALFTLSGGIHVVHSPRFTLWCNTCWPLGILFYIPVNRHWWISKLGSIMPLLTVWDQADRHSTDWVMQARHLTTFLCLCQKNKWWKILGLCHIEQWLKKRLNTNSAINRQGFLIIISGECPFS